MQFRIAFIGVSHWHFRPFLDPMLAIPDVKLVGVSDANEQIARAEGERFGCKWSSDYREICRSARPDFVFALGRHCDMAEEATFLVGESIPFAMEKPCG